MARITTQVLVPFPHSSSFTHLLLAFILLLPAALATFTPTWTVNATQCSPFVVQWTATASSRAGPPFNLLIVPVNPPGSEFPNSSGLTGANLSAPIQVSIPDTSWTAANKTGTYTINALPLRSGERFVVVMDDGFGRGTGGVSDIQTVSLGSGPTDCLGPIGSDSNVLFDLSTFAPAQCQVLSITTAQASAIRGFVPAGSPFSLDLRSGSTGIMTTTWNVNVQAGTSFVLVYIGKDGKLASSGLILTTSLISHFGDSCSVNPRTSTLGLSGSSTDLPGSSQPVGPGGSSSSSSISTPALVGGIIGALAFLAILALVIIYFMFRRKNTFDRAGSRSPTSRDEGRSTMERYKNSGLSGSGRLLENGQAERNEGGSGRGGPGVGEDGYFDEGRGGVRNEASVPVDGAVITPYLEANRRDARAEGKLARRFSDPSSFVTAGATMSSAHQTEEDRRTGGRTGDLSAIDEVSGYGFGTQMTTQNLAGQSGERRHSFKDSAPCEDGSSRAMLADTSGHEKSTIANSNPTSGTGLAVGATTATRSVGWRPSITTNSGVAPYHLPSSLVRSSTGTAASPVDSGMKVHEYSPVMTGDSEPSSRANAGGVTTSGSHAYATAQRPFSDAHSSLFSSSTVQSISPRGRWGVGGVDSGRGEEDVWRGSHPYADPLNSPTDTIVHTDAGPVVSDSDEGNDDGEGGGERRRLVELPPSYCDVTSSNRGGMRDNGGG